MIPTAAIEFLLTLERPSGGVLVSLDAVQIRVPIFPPGQAFPLTIRPPDTDYAAILYGAKLGEDMVPNAFEGYMQVWGSRIMPGIITATAIATEMQTFLRITQAEPALLYLSNISGLNQVCEMNYISLRIQSEEDFNLVLEALARYGSSSKLEKLAVDSNRLLKILAGEAPAKPGPALMGGQ